MAEQWKMIYTLMKQNKIGKIYSKRNNSGNSEIRNKQFRFKHIIKICQCINKLVAVFEFISQIKEQNILY